MRILIGRKPQFAHPCAPCVIFARSAPKMGRGMGVAGPGASVTSHPLWPALYLRFQGRRIVPPRSRQGAGRKACLRPGCGGQTEAKRGVGCPKGSIPLSNAAPEFFRSKFVGSCNVLGLAIVRCPDEEEKHA